MANSYFSFKEFTVHQEKCAMKVCTDACLFGAWSVQQISKHTPGIKNILDIGTGTGLLSLMLAQNFNVTTDAVEINADAASQAAENFKNSPWTTLHVHNNSIADFVTDKKYDFIISNPPFYEGDLQSPDDDRNAAMHNSYLTLDKLLQSIDRLMSRDGKAAILLPFQRMKHFKDLMLQQGFCPVELTNVRQSVNHNYFRCMVLLSRGTCAERSVFELSIYDGNKQYTSDFVNLLKDYYLSF